MKLGGDATRSQLLISIVKFRFEEYFQPPGIRERSQIPVVTMKSDSEVKCLQRRVFDPHHLRHLSHLRHLHQLRHSKLCFLSYWSDEVVREGSQSGFGQM